MELVFKSIYKQAATYGGKCILAGGAVIRSISGSMYLKWARDPLPAPCPCPPGPAP